MNCNTPGMLSLFYYIKIAMTIIFIAAPIILLVLGTIDFLKVVTSGDEKNMKKSVNDFIKRLVICVVILLLPLIINIIMSVVNVKSYKECFANATKANIEKLDIKSAEEDYKKAYESLERADYIAAVDSLNKVSDSNSKTELKNKLIKLELYITLNEKVKNSTGNYNELKEEISKISDVEIKIKY